MLNFFKCCLAIALLLRSVAGFAMEINMASSQAQFVTVKTVSVQTMTVQAATPDAVASITPSHGCHDELTTDKTLITKAIAATHSDCDGHCPAFILALLTTLAIQLPVFEHVHPTAVLFKNLPIAAQPPIKPPLV